MAVGIRNPQDVSNVLRVLSFYKVPLGNPLNPLNPSFYHPEKNPCGKYG